MSKPATPVMIEIISRISTEDGPEAMRLQVAGRLKETSQGWILHYVETSCEPGEEPLSQDVLLQLRPGIVQMTRSGDFGAVMVFEAGKSFTGAYRTPYGEMELQLFTSEVFWEVQADSGKIHLRYELQFQGDSHGIHSMDILFHPRPC